MILQPQHTHSHISSTNINLLEQQQDTDITQILLQQIKQMSERRLKETTISDITQMRKFYQQKVYLSFSSNPADYLSHLLQRNGEETKDHVSILINYRQNQIAMGIDNKQYELKYNPPNNLKQIRNDLIEKISDIKSDMLSVSQIEQRQKKQLQLYQNYMEFRKPCYWNQKNEKSEQVRQFLKKMGQIKTELKKKYQYDLKQREEIDKKNLQQKRQAELRERNDHISKALQRQIGLRKNREKQSKQNQARRGQIQQFLSQYKIEKPLFLVNQQRFKKQVIQPQEQQFKKKLQDIRKSHRPIDPQEIQDHMRKYEQFKEKLKEVDLKRQQEKEFYERNKNQLEELYHGHFHRSIEKQIKKRFHIRSEKKKYRQKIIEYRDDVRQKYKPKTDPKKKKELEQMIRELELNQDKSKRKKVKSDGTVVYQEKDLYDHKQIGNQYLNLVRKFNQGKPQKSTSPQDRSVSMMELSKKPKINYLHQLKEQRGRSTLSGWKKVLDSSSLTSKDKYDSVMGSVIILEQQARKKQLQLKSVQNKQKAYQIKEELDKYYLQSVAAKMVVLKDVILKD